MNYRSYEDRERTLEEIHSLSFNTLYLGIYAFISSFMISFHDFLVLFALIS